MMIKKLLHSRSSWVRPARSLRKKRILPSIAFWGRRQWILGLFVVVVAVLLGKAIDLQILHRDFLQNQGHFRHLRTVPITAHRGLLMDRHGEYLAISTPVESVWINPKQFITAQSQWAQLTALLKLNPADLEKLLADRMQREFVYIKRHLSPTLAAQVKALNLPGVFLQREYRRYYPTGEVSAHLLGFTNIDDQGQEGLERALEPFLKGHSGAKQVLQDKNGRIIAHVNNLQIPKAGQNIRLSIDRRLQYLAYRELKAAVQVHQALAGSVVILDIHTGEILALANQPAYNPNNRSERNSEHYRNRVVTDVFEPGSTIKPFIVASALESGHYTPTSLVNTHPGYLKLGQYKIQDSHNYGIINVATVIQKSSNVGMSKIALSLSAQPLWHDLKQFSFGQLSGSGLPGEVTGYLPHFKKWYPARQASISFGYGMNITLLQLARAYAALGREGVLPPLHFLAQQPLNETAHASPTTPLHFEKFSQPTEHFKEYQLIRPKTARQILHMLENVIKPGGTGVLAQVKGFRIAGKTGTVRKISSQGYMDNKYIALFAGIVPVTHPRLVMVILIDEPHTDHYYGGQVAAPVFAKVMTHALKLLNVTPDDWSN